MKYSISLIILSLIVVGTATGFGFYVWHWEHRPHVLEIYCFALDKSGNSPGNLAVFIRTPDGHTTLIDGGKSDAILRALGGVMPFYRRSIDTIISTNPDDSHVAGLVGVISRYHIGQIIEAVPASSATSSAFSTFENEISIKNIKHIEVSMGDRIDFGDPKLSVNVIFPTDTANSSGFPFSKTNQPILAFSIVYGSTTIIFAGDMTKKEQAYVASSTTLDGFSQKLLILPHGENIDAADGGFFDELKPQTVVVLKNLSVPKKPKTPKFPAENTPTKKQKKPPKPPFDISAIAGLSIVNLATDGDVEFISDGSVFMQKKLK